MGVIFRPLQPIKWFSKVVSLWPYTLSLSLKSLDVFYGLLMFSINMVAANFYLERYTHDKISKNKIIYSNQMICLFLMAFVGIAALKNGLFNNKVIVNILHEYEAVDQDLSVLGVETDVNKTDKFQSALIIMVTIINLPSVYCLALFEDISFLEATYEHYAYAITLFQTSAVPILVIGLAHVLKTRFQSINFQLKQLLHDVTVQPPAEVLKKLQQLVNVHINMRAIVQEVNACFSLILALFVGFIVTEASLSLLAVLQSLDAEITKLESRQMVLFSYFILKGLVLIISLTEVCQAAALEANKSVLLIHRLHQPETDISILKEIEIFSLGMIRNYVTFSAGGFLDVDRGLMTKVCITITTYLVISLQIKDTVDEELVTTALSTVVENVTNATYF